MRLLACLALLLMNGWAFGQDKPFEMTYPLLTTFEYSGPGHIEIQQGKENKLVFKAPNSVQNLFSMSYSDGTLQIQPKKRVHLSQIPQAPHILLIVNCLEKLILEGNNYVDIDYLKTDSFMLDIKENGSSSVEGTIQSERLAVSIVGSSQATLQGGARYQSIMISGPGLYDGKDFATDETSVRLLGASACLVNASDKLSISIQGYGHVHYYGSPKIEKSIKGEGVVSPITKEIIEQYEAKK